MKTVACCTPYVPVEWIAAHGLRPQRIELGMSDRGSTAAGLRGVCPFAGALVDTVDRLQADALVMATTCDQLRRAVSLAQQRARLPIQAIHVPATWQTAAARSCCRDELVRLSRFLVRLGGVAPSGDQLARAIDGSRQEASLVRAGQCKADAVPLALVGGPLLAKDRILVEWLERAGGYVAIDASEGGLRTLPRWPASGRVDDDPLEVLIEAYFLSIPDAFRRPNDLLYEWLGRAIAARGVRGIVFHRYVWCDIWHGELGRLRQWSPVPVLDLDAADDQPCVENRVLGRIEAFLEGLR